MRNLYIGLSILCFVLSGSITFKALNLSEKNPLNLEALSQVKSHKSPLVIKEILTEPAIEQALLNLPVETLQNMNSQLEQKPANESAANIQTLQDTVKLLQQKLANESAASQINIPVLPDTAKQLKQRLINKDNVSQTVQPAKSITTQLEQKLANENLTLQDTVKQLEQKLVDKIAGSQIDIQPVKNIIVRQEYTPEPLKNVSQSNLNISEPGKTEKILTLLLGDIAFSPGEFVINDNMTKSIEQSAQHILTFFPNCRVVVEGHTDILPISKTWQNRYKNNMELSFLRAKAIARAFEKEGILSKRISVIGSGDMRPIASNDTVEGRAKNRRVVVKLIPNEKER